MMEYEVGSMTGEYDDGRKKERVHKCVGQVV